MDISIAICVHDEYDYLNLWLPRLFSYIEADGMYEYETVFIDDNSSDKTKELLNKYKTKYPNVSIYEHNVNKDFATHKNFMNSKCTGDYILNLDADEHIEQQLFFNLTSFIHANPTVDAYWIPRINTVTGITLAHISKWGWTISKLEELKTSEILDKNSEYYKLLQGFQLIISEQDSQIIYYTPIICAPDFQMRLYKNDSKIQWINKVHERLTGFENYTHLTYDFHHSIQHYKQIARQEEQNKLYETIK